MGMDTFNQDQAYAEGWCISHCSGSSYFPDGWYNIEMVDGESNFENDLEAVAFVYSQAATGSQYHRDAVIAMEEANFNRVRESEKQWLTTIHK